jgi:NAD(P) transhydrogenase subunit beta
MKADLINVAYVVATILFISGLKGLTHPRTAVRGNLMGAMGMLVATVAVLFSTGIVHWAHIAIGIGIGTAIGALLALKVQMTGMPELVALFNGLGGAASALVAAAEISPKVKFMAGYVKAGYPAVKPEVASVIGFHSEGTYMANGAAIGMAALIGALTFTGSVLAFLKLRGTIWRNYMVAASKVVNGLLVLAGLALVVVLIFKPSMTIFWAIIALSSVLGITLVIPIGGADMPVIIALLNSYSGLAASAAGFVLQNTALIIAGSLVGASGLILTAIMCKAMNRSLANVLFGGVGGGTAVDGPSADDVYAGKIKSTSADEVAMILEDAQRVVFVPGYGMAVAQAQHAVRDLMNLLEENDVNVEFGIHPVAGRMPGHMNVLLAESDVPYEKLIEMDAINPTMEQVDVCIVLGANDVVNPIARTDPNSPIAGMPIIDVDKARTVVVIKRSLSPGFAGIPNPLFALDNTLMLFGDGKKMCIEMVEALKEAAA